MNILFFLSHPAHYHLFKNTIYRLYDLDYSIKIIIIKKDILEALVQTEPWDYLNLIPEGRRFDRIPVLLASMINLIRTEWRLIRLLRKQRFNLLVGTELTLAHIGKLFNIPSLLFNEDDTSATPENYLFYPFCTHVVMPACCDSSKWERKKITYQGYHELAYLHPDYFSPCYDVVKRYHKEETGFFLLRLADLRASHDIGKSGVSADVARRIISRLEPHGQVYITSERTLEDEFESYRLHIEPVDMPHFLSFAKMFIGDSQTMTAESAVLGTPVIRFNDFVGRLSYLEELEHTYELTYGFRTDQQDMLYAKIDDLLQMPDIKKEWQRRRQRMLAEAIDVNAFMFKVIMDHLSQNTP